jgi:hypothetical protein
MSIVDPSRSEVKNIFDPIVDCIVRLVKQQVTDVHRKGEKVAVSDPEPSSDQQLSRPYRRSSLSAGSVPPSIF